MDVVDKTVLITGSTDGVGELVALRLAGAGASALLHGRNKEKVSISTASNPSELTPRLMTPPRAGVCGISVCASRISRRGVMRFDVIGSLPAAASSTPLPDVCDANALLPLVCVCGLMAAEWVARIDFPPTRVIIWRIPESRLETGREESAVMTNTINTEIAARLREVTHLLDEQGRIRIHF